MCAFCCALYRCDAVIPRNIIFFGDPEYFLTRNTTLSHVDTLLQTLWNMVLAKMYNLEKPVGQIFCGTHTLLGLSNTMNKLVMEIELNKKLETILSGFMVSIELDSKNKSLAGKALDMMLKLVAPVYKHKSWNYFGLYVSIPTTWNRENRT